MSRLRHMIRLGPSAREIRNLGPDEEVTFVPMEALSDGLGGLDASNLRPLGDVMSGSYNYCAEGDILLAKVTPCFENGKKGVAQGLKNGVGFATSEVHVLRPDITKIERRFLLYVLSSEDFRAEGMRSMTGSGGLRRVNEAAILDHCLRVTDLDAQKAIADFLDRETARIDQLIEKKEHLIALLKERFHIKRDQSLQSISTSERRPLRWMIKALCDGPFGSGLTSAHYSDAGVRVIRLQNIKDGGFDDADQAYISEAHYASLGDHDVHAGDLLVAGLGDEKNKVGRACVFPAGLEPAMVKADCFRLRLDTSLLSHSFAAEFFCSSASWDQISALAKGVTRVRLNLELLRRLSVPAPPMQEQHRIVDRIELDRRFWKASQEKTAASLHRLREFRTALITAAVTGRIDVSDWRKQGRVERRLDDLEARS